MSNLVELSIPTPDGSALIEAQNLLGTAEHRSISTDAEYQAAAIDLTHIKGRIKRLEDQRMSITRPIDHSKKVVMDFFRAPLDYLTRAENALKRALVDYSTEQDRLRQEEQRRADEAARKQREKLEAQAAKAAAAGKAAKAEQLEERAATVVAPMIQREAPRVSGVSTREVWKFEITDPSLIPRQYLEVDEAKIRRVVQAMKADANIPGVRVYAERQLAAGAA